ncbi:MAG: SoxR reducing system RseC family protein [Burkholderiaceae bacterium]|nr:SoxR reducing system RseC family protein [Sulfuritalea sp.]MCF8174555.1 SoxR reducing system RseC family protein [Burkholderiaceae bacterium]MCF8184880.1 SoxR reducing system RseC family protein [Polynucleobacter sp.]
MSQCDAVVVEASGNQVWVEVPKRESACENCQTPEACQDGLLGLRTGPRRYRLENVIGAQVGDRVHLTVAEGTLWRASLASYVMPVLLAIIGAAIGQSIAGDLYAALGTLAGLGCGLALLRINEMRARYVANPYSLQIQTNTTSFKEQS